jgi:hypothetical protein
MGLVNWPIGGQEHVKAESVNGPGPEAGAQWPALAHLAERLVVLREGLVAEDPEDHAAARRLDELAISLRALEALSARAAGDEALALVVTIRLRALARELAGHALEVLGYYALPAYDPLTMGNEGPLGGKLAQDAMVDLFRYVGGLDDLADRDRLSALTVASTAS